MASPASYFSDLWAMVDHALTLSLLMTRFIARYAYIIFRQRVLEAPISDEAFAGYNARTAREYVHAAMKLKGGTIKMGQFLSARADIMPKELVTILGQLQDRVTAAPYAQVAAALRAQYGRDPETVFASIEHEAVAAASFGQVHRAVTPQGDKVVVKVLHRHIERSLKVDLAIYKVAVFFFERLFPRFNLNSIYDEIATATFAELDYAREADSAERVRKNLANDTRVRVPKVMREFCRPKVLCLEDISGHRVDDLDFIRASGSTPREVLTAIVGVYCQQIYVDGFFQSDPHPGNLFFYPPGNGEALIGLIDFGQSKEMSVKIQQGLRLAVSAVVRKDPQIFLQAMVEMEVIESAELPKVKDVVYKLASQIPSGSVNEVMNIDFESLARDVVHALREIDALTLPGDLILYGRTLSLLHGLAFRLDPSLPIFEVAAPYIMRFAFGGDASKLESAAGG